MAGKSLAQGLMASSGDQLRLIYVLVMETGIFSMMANKTRDLFNKEVDHSQQQLDQEIAKLRDVDDNKLRLELFLHMTREFELAGSHYNTSYEIENKCGEVLQKAHAYQIRKDKDYSTFVSRNMHLPIENQLALYQMKSIFGSIGGELNNLTADEQDDFTDQIEKFIESLPLEQQEKIKEKLNIDAVTNSTIKRVMLTQGSAVLLSVIVEIAGFAAYTTLTSLIAGTAGLIGLTLPFGFYLTATSVLSVLTGPVGLLLMGGASGMMMLTQSKKVKKTLLQMGIVQLMLPVLLDDSKVYEYDTFIQEWSQHYHKQELTLGLIADHRQEYSRIFQELKAAEDQISVQSKQLMENIHAYHELMTVLADSLDLVSEDEMTASFKQKKMSIADLEGHILMKQDSVRRNKQRSSFVDKVSGMFSNLSLENEIKKIKKQIQALIEEQAVELLSLRPVYLLKECDEAQTLLDEKQIISANLAKLREQKRMIEKELSTINSMILQKQDELRNLQKDIYGLGDIV